VAADTRPAAARLRLGRSEFALVRRLWARTVRAVGWGVADQAVSSLTNFAVSIYVARTLGAVQLGEFSLAYVTYGFALNASRGLATDPLMVRVSGTDVATWRRAVTNCTGTAVIVGMVTGTLALVAAVLLPGTAGAAFLGLGLTLPGLMLQDSWRYSFFALGRGGQAFLNDCVWAVALLLFLELLRLHGHPTVFWLVLAWGASATVGAAVGPLQARVIPRLSGCWDWVSQHRDLGPRYLLEGTAGSASSQLRSYGIGIILSLAALGYVQAATTLFGPMTILFLGMGLVLLPEAAKVLRRDPRRLPLFSLLVSAGLAAAALGWGIVLLIAVPRGLGQWLIPHLWRNTYPLVVPSMLFVMGQAAAAGAGTGLHALGSARRSLRLAVVTSVITVGCSLAGAFLDGAVGTLAGAAVAAWIGALISWRQLGAAMREYRQQADGAAAPPDRHSGKHRAPRRAA
jgi:O-antigen/teichoic acid export membrane protein